MGNKLINDYSYSSTFKWFVIIFLLLVSSTLAGLFYLNNSKDNDSYKINEIKDLSEELNKLNQNIELQFSSGFVNTSEIFIDYGYFKEKTIKHAGLEDLELLDSISRVGKNISFFKLKNQNKNHLEILYNLVSLDTMLLGANTESFFTANNYGKREITKLGIDYRNKWSKKYKTLKRLFTIDLDKTNLDVQKNATKIFILTIVFIIIILLFALAVIIYVGLVVFRDIKILNTNSQLIKNGKKPTNKNTNLFGEARQINNNLNRLFNDIDQTKSMLEMIHTDSNSNIHENKIYKNNILYESVSKLELQLKDLRKKEKNRNWTVKGISQLTEVVNQFSSNPEKLYSSFLVKLIKYLDSIQGGIFIAQNENELKMVTSYAYDRIKQQKKIIKKGEGLVGQVWEEEKHLYTENVPKDHAHIKSALGVSKSTCLVVTPLMERNTCFGVLEISSFQKFNSRQLELILKACEILAATTSNITTNLTTKKLLEDSNKLGSVMKTQEEDLNKKIKILENKIEDEKQSAYLKERALRDLRFDSERTIELRLRQIQTLESRLEDLKASVTRSQSNNEFTRELKNDLQNERKKVEDLNETMRIKNLKIERLKTKIEKLSK